MSRNSAQLCPNNSAQEIHAALKSALKTMVDAEQCAIKCFGEIMARRLYRDLGFGSIQLYAQTELGFSPRRTRDFVMLCEKLKQLPLVKQEVESGRLGYTKARVLVPVVDKENEKDWVDYAKTHSRRQLEQEVKRGKTELADKAAGQPSLLPVPQKCPAAVVPVRVGFEMTAIQFARYQKLWERIRKQRSAAPGQVEALLEIMQTFADGGGPRGPELQFSRPPVQIHVHHCEECAKTTVQTGRGELVIGTNEWERAQCDCQTDRPGARNSTSVPPATRRQVLARYRHKCQRSGCQNTRYLEVHHIVPRNEGGSNDAENLTVLCSGCHSLLHERTAGELQVKSPAAVYLYQPVAGHG